MDGLFELYGAAKSGAANLSLGEGVKVRQMRDAAISGPQLELWCTAKTPAKPHRACWRRSSKKPEAFLKYAIPRAPPHPCRVSCMDAHRPCGA
jgi:hypothetical protein